MKQNEIHLYWKINTKIKVFFISLVKQISCFYFRLIVKTTILYEVASKGCKPETSLYEVLQEFATGLELSSLVILDATSSMNRTE